MKLNVYLALKDMTLKEFSKKIKCNQSYLSRVSRRHVKPSDRLVKDIEQETGGEVTADDFLKCEKCTCGKMKAETSNL